MNTHIKILAITLLAALPLSNSQAGWMQSEGDFAVSSGLGYKDNANYFDMAGKSMKNTCGSGFNVPLFAEYGYSYYNTLYATSSLDSFSCGVTKMQGINDIEVGTRGHMDYFIDHNWELAAIFPQHISPTGAANLPKQFGIKAGIHSSLRLEPYQTFLTESEIQKNNVAYGGGIKYWTGDVPGELWGYVGYSRILKDSDWAKDIGGWSFNARLDAKNSLGKTHPTAGFAGVGTDQHDAFRLVQGQIGFTRTLSVSESMNFSIDRGLWGKNIGFGSGFFATYSKVFRKN